MAEFCNNCALFEEEVDIDLRKIGRKLAKGHQEVVLCEGCDVNLIRKDVDGKLTVVKLGGVELPLEMFLK